MEENIEKVEKVEKEVQRSPRPRTERPAGDRRNNRDRGRGPRRNDRQEKQYEEVVVSINRISKTVSGGRRMRFAALVVIGDRKGNVGFGTGKANEVPDAIKKAIESAKKELFRISMVRGDTVPHTQIGKYGACEVFIRPAPEGTGIIAGNAARKVFELAGIRNIYSKVYGSRSPINMVRATIQGLRSMKTATKIATLRGKEINEIIVK